VSPPPPQEFVSQFLRQFVRPIASATEAAQLTAHFVEVMDVLVAVVQRERERERELVRAEHLAKATVLEATNSDARDPTSRPNCWVS
jgi:hypothetical protein